MEGDFQRIPFPNLPNVKELLDISESLSAFVANYLKKKTKTFTINTNKNMNLNVRKLLQVVLEPTVTRQAEVGVNNRLINYNRTVFKRLQHSR